MTEGDRQPPPNQPPDWFAQNAPPVAGTSQATGSSTPSTGYINPDGTAGGYVDQPAGGFTYDGPGGAPTNLPPGYYWDPSRAAIVKLPGGATAGPAGGGAPGAPGGAGGAGGAGIPGAPPNFGIGPTPYAAPTWEGGAPPGAPAMAHYTLPTMADLFASPGFQSRFQTGQQGLERSAAAHGTILNGGTQKALAEYGQNYASNEYNNLVNQTMATQGFNNAADQTQFGDAVNNYQARYGQFTTGAAMGKNAYDTNTANKRTTDLDYWGRLNDLYNTGAGLAGNSYKPPA